jgi:hypothetical protein
MGGVAGGSCLLFSGSGAFFVGWFLEGQPTRSDGKFPRTERLCCSNAVERTATRCFSNRDLEPRY